MYPFCGQVAFRGWSWLTTRSAGSILTARIVAPRASRTTAAIPKFIVRSVDKGRSNMKMHKNNRRSYYTQISHRAYISCGPPLVFNLTGSLPGLSVGCVPFASFGPSSGSQEPSGGDVASPRRRGARVAGRPAAWPDAPRRGRTGL